MYELGVRSGLAPLTELVAASALIAVSSAPFLVAIPHLVGGEWAHGLALLATGTVTVAIALVVVIAAVSRLGHRHAGTDDPVDTTARSRRREWAHYLSGRSVAYTACLFAWGGTLTGVVVFLLLCGIVGLMVPVASMGDDPVQVLGLDVDGGFRATVSAGVGVLLLLVALRCLASLGRVQARLAKTFLVDIATEELFEVTTSRHRMLKGFDAERQRIERDLHDGVQPLLVSVSMKLGLARSLIEPGTPGHADLVAAHTQAKQLMGVMRELVHGIYPRVLAESGLESALRGLAIASVVPTRVRAESLPRCSPDVESVAYFCTSELLTNVNKHSGATEATMSVCVDDGVIVIQIRDNGRGGAMYGLGTGLTGVADRVATVAGSVTLSSPEGGPTEAMLRLPFEGG